MMHGPKMIVLTVVTALLLINSVKPSSARERRLKHKASNVLLSSCPNLPTISFFMFVLFVDAVTWLSLRNFLFCSFCAQLSVVRSSPFFRSDQQPPTAAVAHRSP
jgi:hypothetical protein